MNSNQIELVLNFPAFQLYNDVEKLDLKNTLTLSSLNLAQLNILFSSDMSGGLICDLVEDSNEKDYAAQQLGKILNNISESIDGAHPPRAMINLLIGNLGAYNQIIAADVKRLVNQYIRIHKGRVIYPPEETIPNNFHQDLAPYLSNEQFDTLSYSHQEAIMLHGSVIAKLIRMIGFGLENILNLNLNLLGDLIRNAQNIPSEEHIFGYQLLMGLRYSSSSQSLINLVQQQIEKKFEEAHPNLLNSVNSTNFFKKINGLNSKEIVFLWEKFIENQESIISSVENLNDFMKLASPISIDLNSRGNYTIFPQFTKMLFNNPTIFNQIIKNFDDYLILKNYFNSSSKSKRLLFRHLEEKFCQLIKKTNKLDDYHIAAICSNLNVEQCRKLARENKEKISLKKFIRCYQPKRYQSQLILLPPGAHNNYKYSKIYNDYEQIVLIKNLNSEILYFPEEHVFYRPYSIELSEEELKILKFPLAGEQPVTIHYRDNPSLYRSIIQQCPRNAADSLDPEQFKTICEEIPTVNNIEPCDLKSIPPNLALLILKKLATEELLKKLIKFLDLPQFRAPENSNFREELVTYFHEKFPSNHRIFPSKWNHLPANLAFPIIEQTDPDVLISHSVILLDLYKSDKFYRQNLLNFLPSLPWHDYINNLHQLTNHLTNEEKRNYLNTLANKHLSWEFIQGINTCIKLIDRGWQKRTEKEKKAKMDSIPFKDCFCLKNTELWEPWLSTIIEHQEMPIVILKNSMEYSEILQGSYQFPNYCFNQSQYQDSFQAAEKHLKSQFEQNKKDSFALTLEEKINYYKKRQSFLLGVEGAYEKSKLYAEIAAIFSEHHNFYIFHKERYNATLAQEQCLKNIWQDMGKLRTSLTIDKGRDILAKAFQIIKSIAEFFYLAQPDGTEKFKMVNKIHLFSSIRPTQTVKDVKEIENLCNTPHPSL